MSWITFLIYLGLGYALYYAVVFLSDRSRSVMDTAEPALPVLTFSEEVKPEKIALADVGAVIATPSCASTGLGGISLKEMFDLARKDAIQYTSSVSF